MINQSYFIFSGFLFRSSPHVKYEISFTINALIIYRDPFSTSQTEIT